MTLALVTATITAPDSFTDWVRIAPGQRASLSLAAVTDSTVTVQRRLTATGPARDYKAVMADAELVYEAGGDEWLRVGVKTGEFGTDQPVVAIKIG